MQVPVLPLVVGGVALTFLFAVLGWWVASRVERRRRIERRNAETNRRWEQQGGARPPH
ncbi:hypothetical protein [Microlunatus flavus]|uniref:Uncharacterized protein n=1 Tax=Microlunatus flavus TaxID=1036181 RepID=A0A1H9K4T4_9ACTN|nr:hypothetical protein [Microlunatus flavus]SEQ94211.1 hypothetical protein SAMN05421756_10769 [Microlunatus flavus]